MTKERAFQCMTQDTHVQMQGKKCYITAIYKTNDQKYWAGLNIFHPAPYVPIDCLDEIEDSDTDMSPVGLS